ncbi:JAB domain-containing protein [Candidatus Thiodictyon syntrophicum]|jgi:DNA repair protein RadC|uniref:RadC-like JAB domain-containing protein n=1 Tax=Candidatus Thiodictyon syntrophicum TaxID=1166950 RepID=A0A2K8U8Q9_9GAMM|nr:JAB domain-containing protein [Candidatus Thiodictyon syntrophicum]AUB81972.1 hypothetical protein THSYN_14140 [Candidatus Thiodictyon syntrophicum]
MSYLEGHRQRLRDRFNASGLGAFEDHEVLELLLTHENQVLRALPLHEGSIASAPVYPRLFSDAALRHHAAGEAIRMAQSMGGEVASSTNSSPTRACST